MQPKKDLISLKIAGIKKTCRPGEDYSGFIMNLEGGNSQNTDYSLIAKGGTEKNEQGKINFCQGP